MASFDDNFLYGYINAAIDYSTDDKGNPLSDTWYGWHIANDCRLAMDADCQRFLGMARSIFEQITTDPEELGRLFWLNRNHHGTGFWDSDNVGEFGRVLSDMAHQFGEASLYVGDGEDMLHYFNG